MLLAAGGAILFRVNLPLSVATGLALQPLHHAAAVLWRLPVGCQLLGHPAQHIDIQFTWEWLVSVFETLAPPLLLGSWCSHC